MKNELLRRIAQQHPHLPEQARRIADIVLNAPRAVIKMSMAELARASDTSDPTVVRFFHRFDCEDYQDFKMRLSQGLIPQAPFEDEPITPDDPPARLCDKVITHSLHAIQRLAADLDVAAIEQAADRLLQARGVFLFGLGISETIAFDAEHKLFRLGLHCRTVLEARKQLLLAPTLHGDEVALFFSHSGATKTLVRAATQARASGAYTIAVTAPGSRLSQTCELTLGTPAYENTDLYTPLTARLSHLLVVNLLTTLLSSRQGRDLPGNLPALDPWVTEKWID